MIKRVNSLGRRRVSRNCVAIAVNDGEPRTFSASIDFGDHAWEPEASVVMEATCAGSSLVQRYDCGTIAKLDEPRDRALNDLHGQNVFFSLKIIDRSQRVGRLLGVAENIRPLTHRVVEVGPDYVRVRDMAQVSDTLIPIYSIKAITIVRLKTK